MTRISFQELRRQPSKLLDALARNETVTLTRRGVDVAQVIPPPVAEPKKIRAQDSPAFGMWKDHPKVKDPAKFVRELRKGRRFDDL